MSLGGFVSLPRKTFSSSDIIMEKCMNILPLEVIFIKVASL
jgi:hypothetical protein